jgi:hypothetical protein
MFAALEEFALNKHSAGPSEPSPEKDGGSIIFDRFETSQN